MYLLRDKNTEIILQISIFFIPFLSDRLWVNKAALLHCCNMYSEKSCTSILIKNGGGEETTTKTLKSCWLGCFYKPVLLQPQLCNFCLFRQLFYVLWLPSVIAIREGLIRGKVDTHFTILECLHSLIHLSRSRSPVQNYAPRRARPQNNCWTEIFIHLLSAQCHVI